MAGDLSANPKGDPFPYREKKLLLKNMGKGKGFEDITAVGRSGVADSRGQPRGGVRRRE